MESAEARLIAEQLGRMQDAFKGRMDALEEQLRHHTELDAERASAIKETLADLKEQVKDHEQRIRAATDGVTSFRVWSGLAAGGSGIVSVIAFIKSFLP